MTGTSKGPAYVSLEVTTQCDDDAAEMEMGYQHLPFSQRVARRRRRQARYPSVKSKLIAGVAAACIVGAFVLWAWASVLLLQRLSSMRFPKVQEEAVPAMAEDVRPRMGPDPEWPALPAPPA
ncbi:unnamed protein product [Symbiodinium natans]|uniref:Uncharacterized protein n=1 Tax=Symbiodinium natans TaxID=878477 RepID=A0A812NGE4_9DINO|nr:unnamed protein product [Symbiodinium natans]